jgi:hypothetical protein
MANCSLTEAPVSHFQHVVTLNMAVCPCNDGDAAQCGGHVFVKHLKTQGLSSSTFRND